MSLIAETGNLNELNENEFPNIIPKMEPIDVEMMEAGQEIEDGVAEVGSEYVEMEEEIDILGLSPSQAADMKPFINELQNIVDQVEQQNAVQAPPARRAATQATAKFTNHDESFQDVENRPKRQNAGENRRYSIKKTKPKPKIEEIQRIASKYQGRLDYFKRKHRQSKAKLVVMEQFSAKTLENVEELMDGNISVATEAFKNYKMAIEAYQQAQRLVRVTLLTERKLASEVWGANNISIYDEDNGTYTILENIIEELLHVEYYSPYEVKEKKERKPQNDNKKNIKMPVIKKKLMPPESDKPKSSNSFHLSDLSCDENMAITRSMTTKTVPEVRQKMVNLPAPTMKNSNPAKKRPMDNFARNEPNDNVNQTISKKKRANEPQSEPQIIHKIVSAPHVNNLPFIPKVKQTPMPKFTFVEESIVKSKNAQQVVKDAAAFMCNCKPDKNGFGCFTSCINHHLHMECGSRCFLKEKCQNKKFQNNEYASFEPFFAGAKGWGIKAKEKIKAGQFIVEYLGEIIDGNETTRRLKKYAKNNHRHHYMMGLRNGAVIDATTYGNYSRFINHSCDPNAETQKWVVSKQLKIGFFALKDILPGDEIVFDYAFERFGKKAQVCYCGSSKCTGFLGGKPVEEDEENSSVEISEDEEDNENDESTTVTAVNSDGNKVVKVAKRKRTEEEKELLKRMAHARKRVVRARREVRKIIRKKKNFNKEDIQKIVQYMVTVKTYEEKLIVSDILLTITDEQILKWFVEQKSVLAISLWLMDYTCGKSFKRCIRLQYQLVKFLSRLPVEYSDEIDEGHIIALLKNRMESTFDQERIILETMKDMLFKVCDDAPTKDNDVLRCMEMDGESLLDLHEWLVKDAEDLISKFSKLQPKPIEVIQHEENERNDENQMDFDIEPVHQKERYEEREKERRYDDRESRKRRRYTPSSESDRNSRSPSISDSRSTTHSRSGSRSISVDYGKRRRSSDNRRHRSRSYDRHYSRSRSHSRSVSRSRSRSRSPDKYRRKSSYRRRSRSRSRSYSPRRRSYHGRRHYHDDYYHQKRYSSKYSRSSFRGGRGRGYYYNNHYRQMSPLRQPMTYSPVRSQSRTEKCGRLSPVPHPKANQPQILPQPILSEIYKAFPDHQPILKTNIEIMQKKKSETRINGNVDFESMNTSIQMNPQNDPSPIISDPIHSRHQSEERNVTERGAATDNSTLNPYKAYPKNPNWLMVPTDDGYLYFYNPATGVTTWDEPEDIETEKRKQKEVVVKQEIVEQVTIIPTVEVKKETVEPILNVTDKQQQNLNDPKQIRTQQSIELSESMLKKKSFKEKIYNYLLLKYLKNWSKFKYYGNDDIHQFVRTMTHLTLNEEVENGNVEFKITEEVLAKARKLVDKNLAEFVKHTRPIIPFDAHAKPASQPQQQEQNQQIQ